jgi:hypothetical protein
MILKGIAPRMSCQGGDFGFRAVLEANRETGNSEAKMSDGRSDHAVNSEPELPRDVASRWTEPRGQVALTLKPTDLF